MKTISAYKTTDGQVFETQAAAEHHEMLLSEQSVVEEFLDSDINPYKGHIQRSMVKTTIINWEVWKETNVIPAK